MRYLGQTPERWFQSRREVRIRGSYLANQPLNDSCERSGEFGGVKLADKGVLELRGHSGGQEIQAATVGGGKSVTDAGEREGVVADTADHVFGLP